ncbi:MAG: DUF3048 domain-containing protein [Solibacillus sp.]
MLGKKLSFLMMSVCILAACSNKEEVAPVEALEEPEVIEEVAVEEEVLPFVTPFTGERVAEEVVMRPVLATINNHPDARPQSGLTSADVVYEMLAEGDVTRFLALYQTELPESIGPIRSARSYFIDIADGLDAFYMAHGYSPEAKSMLERRVVDNMNGMQYDGIYFLRSKERRAPHNSYISGENVVAGAEKVGASLLYNKKVAYSFYDEQENVKIGVETNEVNVNYSKNALFNSRYVYDAETNRYTRFSADVETVDYVSGEPLALANVLFFEMPHRIIDSVGRRDIDISQGGKAYLFQAGIMREVKWKNEDGFLAVIEEDGTDTLLVPGQTWVHFVPTSPGLAQSVTYLQQEGNGD